MAAATVRIHGVRETVAAFRAIDAKLARQFGNDLRQAAEPVAATARTKVTRYAGASINTIRPKRSGVRVFVEQGARKVTGKRGDFGALQMRNVLEPALDERADDVYREVDRVFREYSTAEGF
jgi:hypothetical protein